MNLARVGVAGAMVIATAVWVGPSAETSAQPTSPGTVVARPRPQGSGRVQGRVVDGATGRPLRGVSVTAWWDVPAEGRSTRFATRTDGDGAFILEALPDGAYVVGVHRPGFFDPPGGMQPRQVTLRGGAGVDVGEVRLLRGGVLTGRVLDAHGEPVEHARITPVGRATGQDQINAAGPVVTTDDRGVYRAFGLPPGRYTVRAVPLGASARGPVRLQGQAPEPLPAFATSTDEPAAAEFVHVRAGEEAVLDVRLPAGRSTSITGRIVQAGDGPSARPQVSLQPAASEMHLQLAVATWQADGRFVFRDVAPGRYRVVAEETHVFPGRAPSSRRFAGWTEIVATADGVADVVVTMGPGAVVRGRIEVEGGEAAALANRAMQVLSMPSPSHAHSAGGTMVASSTTDLTFELHDVLGHRQLHLVNLPAGWWLESVLIEGEDAIDGREFPVSGTLDGVVLLVSGRPSGVTGRVQGAAADLQGASVLVRRGDGADRVAGPEPHGRISSVAIDGRFTAAGLRPGRYTVVALSPRARSAFERLDRDERAALLATYGRSVDVVAGRLANVDVPVVTR